MTARYFTIVNTGSTTCSVQSSSDIKLSDGTSAPVASGTYTASIESGRAATYYTDLSNWYQVSGTSTNEGALSSAGA